MNDFKTVIAAAGAFERMFDCRLCLHDYIGRFGGCGLPRYHLNPYCTELKKRQGEAERTCVAFDHHSILKRHGNSSEPFFKYCPYGYLEAVFPVMMDGKVCGVLFAGPFRGSPPVVPDAFRENVRLDNSVKRHPPELALGRRSDLLAFGALLAERLAACITHPWPGGGTRKELIEQFITRNCGKSRTGLPDLADFIGLSPARTSELVRKTFGEGFVALLTRERLRMARQLLEYSAFTIESVAAHCGFNDSAYFHRVFQRYCGETPAEYRRRTAKPTA